MPSDLAETRGRSTLVRDDYWGSDGTHSGNFNFDMITGNAAGGGKVYVVNGNVMVLAPSGNTVGKVYALTQGNSIPIARDW